MIRIVTDTISALDPAWTTAHHIPLIPQVIVFGDESYLEVEEISTEAFLRRLLGSKVVAKTAAPPPGLFIKAFEELDAEVDQWCAEIAAMSPTAIALAKRSFNADTESIRGFGSLAMQAVATGDAGRCGGGADRRPPYPRAGVRYRRGRRRRYCDIRCCTG